MLLEYVHTYDATPERVVALMRDEAFLDDVARHAGALEHRVAVAEDSATLEMSLPVPASLAKFVGNAIRINQVFRFSAPRADGTVEGAVVVDVAGMPVDVDAQVELAPRSGSTVGLYRGELKVKLPIVGRKVEAQVEPFIRDAFDGLERRAHEWLAR